MEYESAMSNICRLVDSESSAISNRNEATTRLQLIDRIFLECLGWNRSDCVCEESQDGQYADYVFSTSHRALIVEAKREGQYFTLPVGVTRIEMSIPALCSGNAALGQAIDQVAGYCQKRGVPVAAVCNGHQLVAFLATRSDGRPPLEGKAVVFSSWALMRSNFKELWNYLSKEGVSAGFLEKTLLRLAPDPVPPKLSASLIPYPGTKNRNPFQTDLKILSDLVLEDLIGEQELELEFLKECYCQSGALSQYALVSKDLLRARYAALFGEGQNGPSIEPATSKSGVSPELLARGVSRRPVLLLGDVGVGKTTFIRHLIRIDAAEVFENAITLYLDLGSQGALSTDLRSFILDELDRQLLHESQIDISEAAFVRSVYHADIMRFRRSIFAERPRDASGSSADAELDHLRALVGKRDTHLRASLEHITRSHRKQVIVFIDNADQRDAKDQETAFLAAQELAATWPATVFLALRPETFHRSQQSGSLSGYHLKAFTIAPPRTDLVLKRRLAFGLRLASGEIEIRSLRHMTRLQSDNLVAILKSFLESLDFNDDLLLCIDNISAGNVREALGLVQGFFGSGHVDTEKIIRKLGESGHYYIPLHEFLRAVIYGDAKYYDPYRSPVANLFDVTAIDPREHFLMPLAIGIISRGGSSSDASGFVDKRSAYDALQSLGFSPHQIDGALLRAVKKGLLESGGIEGRRGFSDKPGKLRITAKGVYHVQRLVGMFVYHDAVIVDTPILDDHVRQQTQDEEDILPRLQRCETFIKYLNARWESAGLPSGGFPWDMIYEEVRRDINKVRRRQEQRRGNIQKQDP